MRRTSIVLAIPIFLLLSCNKKYDYNPESHLDAAKNNEVMNMIIRYIAKAPENVSDEQKFNSVYDEYYQERASFCNLQQYYIDGDVHYFLVTKPAPSLYDKRVGTGGKMKFDRDGKLVEYEEVFRTWKMTPAELIERGNFLFDRMVKGETLDPYYTKNAGDKYIEFPDDDTYFDKSTRGWKTDYKEVPN